MNKAKRLALLVMAGALIQAVLRAHLRFRAARRAIRGSALIAGNTTPVRWWGEPGSLSLETERLTIRPFAPEDAPEIHAVYSDPNLLHRVPGRPSKTIKDTDRTLGSIVRHQRKHGFGLWAVVEKESGRIVGDCGLFPLEGSGPEVEITYRLGRPSWCKGYPKEAVAEVLRFGLEELNLERIVAVLDPDDPASARMIGVMEKAGMSHEGAGRFYGREMFVYSASREKLVGV